MIVKLIAFLCTFMKTAINVASEKCFAAHGHGIIASYPGLHRSSSIWTNSSLNSFNTSCSYNIHPGNLSTFEKLLMSFSLLNRYNNLLFSNRATNMQSQQFSPPSLLNRFIRAILRIKSSNCTIEKRIIRRCKAIPAKVNDIVMNYFCCMKTVMCPKKQQSVFST